MRHIFFILVALSGTAFLCVAGGNVVVPGVSSTVVSATFQSHIVLLPFGGSMPNVQNCDSDADANPDIYEIDNDNDGLTDRDELFALGTDHNNPDTDDDALPDAYEVSHGLNPVLADADTDADDDGLSNAEEFEAGTMPNRPTAIITHGWNLLGTSWTAPHGLGYAQQSVPAALMTVSRHADGEDVAVAADEPLQPTVGYWAFAAGDALVDFKGTHANNHAITLSPGWNLIAPLNNGPIPAEITGPVWTWQDGRFVLATEMRALKGYWLWSSFRLNINVP